jgi:hypothetical protein
MNSAAMTTSTPATPPMMTAAPELTNAQGPVIATRPARRPLQIMVTSGFPKREMRAGLISILALDVWCTDNPFQDMLMRSRRRQSFTE